MKQNEKILVFAVTGFLVVILLVAIVFGKDGSRQPLPDEGAFASGSGAPGLEELLNRISGKPQPVGGAEPLDPGAGVDPAVVQDRPLVVNVLPPPTPASLVTERLGLNQIRDGYRYVRVRSNDTLSGLVQRWCGSIDGYLALARALNEELTVLKVGEEICLPLVDDEVLLAAHEARRGSTGPVDATLDRASSAAPAPGNAALASGTPSVPVEATASGSRSYQLKAGESLWKIGEREVGLRNVPRFLQQVRELNPGLDVDRLREGQTILLPVRS